MRQAKLYVITNLVNSKQYYGWSFNPDRRWVEHQHNKGSKLVYQAIKKYGIENFRFEILCQGEVSFIKEMEQTMIEQECSKVPYGYNLTAGGDGISGCTKETRKKISESQMGQGNGFYGKKHRKDSKQKMREKALKRDSSKHNRVNLSRHPQARKVLVNGKEYGCIKEAALSESINISTLRSRFHRYAQRDKFPDNWGYLNS